MSDEHADFDGLRSEGPDMRRKRLLFRCWHRGTWESDTILGSFAEPLVREVCVLHRLPSTSTAYWQGWNRLRAKMGGKFHTLFDAVSRAMAQPPRSSSLVEKLNLRLRTCFEVTARSLIC